MVESQRNASKPELYERLIDRLAMALDAAKTAGRLRDEGPLELELKGLSRAEFELVKAYLERSERETQVAVLESLQQQAAPRSAEVIWLKDRLPFRDQARARSLRCK